MERKQSHIVTVLWKPIEPTAKHLQLILKDFQH